MPGARRAWVECSASSTSRVLLMVRSLWEPGCHRGRRVHLPSEALGVCRRPFSYLPLILPSTPLLPFFFRAAQLKFRARIKGAVRTMIIRYEFPPVVRLAICLDGDCKFGVRRQRVPPPNAQHTHRRIRASPLAASLWRCRCWGDSRSTTSSVGRTCASMRWPPCAVPSALPSTTWACTCGAP
jgi:hypothetical protein